MRVQFHPAAERELTEAAVYYEHRVPGLGDRFIAEMQRISTLLADRPRLGPKIDEKHRRLALRQFPFSLIYRIDSDVLSIIAVAHKRRRPGYWQPRS